ncbi:MAG: RDD family protein, partial [Enterococcus sp.]|nr:RDD family protein [Enterococcus sp.]
ANLLGWNESTDLISIYGISTLVIYLAYFILLTKLNHGQTIGKMIFGIRVVCFTEAVLSWKTVLVREGACRFILRGSFFMLGYLVAIFTPNKQHLGDYFSDTSVVTINLVTAREDFSEA